MFRDESEHLHRKNTSQHPSPTRAEVLRNLRNMQYSLDLQHSTLPFLQQQMSFDRAFFQDASLEDQALCFVLRNYGCGDDEDAIDAALFGYLPDTDMFSRLKASPCFEDAVMAVGFAGLAGTGREESLMVQAAARYVRAVRGICELLGVEEEVKKDEILVAVLLLGLYETTSSNKPRSIISWTQHTNGAVSLLFLRGDSQLDSLVGRRIFAQIRSNVIRSCIQRRIPVPSSITRYSILSLPHETSVHVAATYFYFIVTRFCSLRATLPPISALTPNLGAATARKVIQAATQIDQQLEGWTKNLPKEYQYQVLTVPAEINCKNGDLEDAEKEVYGDTYHVYTDITIASLWNTYRGVRILVLELLLTYISYHPLKSSLDTPFDPLDSQTQTQTQISTWKRKIHDLCLDILASVPYHFNTHLVLQNKLWTRPPPRALNGELLIWPLYACAVGGLASRYTLLPSPSSPSPSSSTSSPTSVSTSPISFPNPALDLGLYSRLRPLSPSESQTFEFEPPVFEHDFAYMSDNQTFSPISGYNTASESRSEPPIQSPYSSSTFGRDMDTEKEKGRAGKEIAAQRSYIVARLHAVAREMGIGNASALAAVVAKGREVSIWKMEKEMERERERIFREREEMGMGMGGNGFGDVDWVGGEGWVKEEMDEEEEDWETEGMTLEISPLF
ncbi:hypothetical protein EG329_004502 [Mollisiaceae sp. DMI_Dod_QoI]|nr:hypothetical protein EG329_004502 [Helotiales sp. DMI_Dod_QoI]